MTVQPDDEREAHPLIEMRDSSGRRFLAIYGNGAWELDPADASEAARIFAADLARTISAEPAFAAFDRLLAREQQKDAEIARLREALTTIECWPLDYQHISGKEIVVRIRQFARNSLLQEIRPPDKISLASPEPADEPSPPASPERGER